MALTTRIKEYREMQDLKQSDLASWSASGGRPLSTWKEGNITHR